MDSLTQIALGSCVAAACVPPAQRRKAALLGAALGTLPDLDVFIHHGDPVEGFTMHRGFSHSLLVLPPLSLVLWWILLRHWTPVREAPARWLAAILLALLTHPLLDALDLIVAPVQQVFYRIRCCSDACAFATCPD